MSQVSSALFFFRVSILASAPVEGNSQAMLGLTITWCEELKREMREVGVSLKSPESTDRVWQSRIPCSDPRLHGTTAETRRT